MGIGWQNKKRVDRKIKKRRARGEELLKKEAKDKKNKKAK